MALGGIYETGTVTIAVDRVSVTGVGTLWSPIVEVGDWLFVGGQVGLVAAIIDDTHLTLETQWVGTLPSAAVYVIIKMSWLRYDPALTQAKVRELLEHLQAEGHFLFVEGDAPDPAMGEDGQWALKTNETPWTLWFKEAGVWIEQAPPGATIADDQIVPPMLDADTAPKQLAFRQRIGIIERLTAGRNYYVRIDGNDANNGLTNNAGGAFRTIQKAVNIVLTTLDCAGFDVVINVADGTYAESVQINGAPFNIGIFYIIGNMTTPANCIVSANAGDCFFAQNHCNVRISGFKLQTTTSGCGINTFFFAMVWAGMNNYGACVDSHLQAGQHSLILCLDPYTISGSATSHLHAGGESAAFLFASQTITLTGTPNFSAYFAGLNKGSIVIGGPVFSGSATGTRFVCHFGGILDMGLLKPLTYLPGNAAGKTDNGGIVISAEGDAYDTQSPWKSFTPVVTAGSGTFTAVSATCKHKRDGSIGYLSLSITCTTIGTAGGWVIATIPFTFVNGTSVRGVNRDNPKSVVGYANPGNASIFIFGPAADFPFTSGQTLLLDITGEVTPVI